MLNVVDGMVKLMVCFVLLIIVVELLIIVDCISVWKVMIMVFEDEFFGWLNLYLNWKEMWFFGMSV